MSEVKFYILPQAELDARYRFVCRHAEQAFKLGRQVYIHATDEAEAQLLDELLWNFRPDSFVPHGCWPAKDIQAPLPVAIGWQREMPPHLDVLINLAPHVPAFAERFARISEVVVHTPEVLEATRLSYKLYKERGFPLYTHKL